MRLEPTTQLAVSVSTTTMILCFIAVLNKYTVTVTVTMMKNTRLEPTQGPCQEEVHVHQGASTVPSPGRLQGHASNRSMCTPKGKLCTKQRPGFMSSIILLTVSSS